MSLRDSIRSIVDAFVGPRLDLLALYPARVVSQGADGRLDLVPEDARIAPCSGVPLRYGAPGLTATVPGGGRVLLGYEHGDPGRPYAALWESGAVTALSVNGGTVKVARNGDATNTGTVSAATTPPAGVPPIVNLVLTLTPPGAAPQVITISGLPPTVAVTGSWSLPGEITEGSDVLKVP